jgi:hypothetical protein
MVSMFQEPIKGNVFRINFDDLEAAPITDAPVRALGVWVKDTWFSHKTYLLVICEADQKLYWVNKEHFTAMKNDEFSSRSVLHENAERC